MTQDNFKGDMMQDKYELTLQWVSMLKPIIPMTSHMEGLLPPLSTDTVMGTNITQTLLYPSNILLVEDNLKGEADTECQLP